MTRYTGHKQILFLLISIFSIFFCQAQVPDSTRMVQFNQKAILLINQFRFDEAISLSDSALQIKDNATTHYLLAHINTVRKNWKEAIAQGEKAVRLDPGFTAVYPVLVAAYVGAQRWQDAINIGQTAQQADPSGVTSQALTTALNAQKTKSISNIFCWIFFLTLSFVFLAPLFQKSRKTFNEFSIKSFPRLTTLLFVSSAVSCVLYIIFFALSKWIWSLNPQISPPDFSPFVRVFIFEHDGVESFFLYILLFADILISFLITNWLITLRVNKTGFFVFAAIFIAIAGYYFFNIGFNPPVPDNYSVDENSSLLTLFGVGIISGVLYFLYNKNKLAARIIIFLLIAFTSLISVYPSSLVDLTYVLTPALRLSYGYKISSIYFQYDLLLSFLAFCFIKLNLLLDWFPYLGQVSFFLFFLGSFLFAQRFFKNKSLSVLFILALLLVRYYAVWEVQYSIFQVTPLRLDLWLILLWVVYQKGVHHWLAGLCFGFLLIFHRNLGLLYLASYFALILFLLFMDILPLLNEKKKSAGQFLALCKKHFRLNAINLLIIAASVLICFLLSGEFLPASAVSYRKYGIGMLPIERNSFYWYIPVLFSALAASLFYYRNKLTTKYFSTGIFIILLGISNCMYFLGRSHENNLLNISGILILALFILFDILIFSASSSEPVENVQKKNKKLPLKKTVSFKRRVSLLLPMLFILLPAYYYSNRISDKISLQVNNLKKLQLAYPLLPDPVDTATIKEITHHNSKVYFLDFKKDFYYYFYGHYTPQGYFSPSSTWIFKKDLFNFLQDLLDKQYDIVIDANNVNLFNEYLPYLNYNRYVEKNGFVAFRKDNLPFLFSKDTSELFHKVLKDSLPRNGLDFYSLPIKKEFTIELLIKPVGNQPPEAGIVDNMTSYNGVKGLTIQANNAVPDQYVIGLSGGVPTLPSLVFPLENNKWHYLAITVNTGGIKVYDYGKLLATFTANDLSFLNSDAALTVGNKQSKKAHFSGYIREIKFSNGNPEEAEIVRKGAELNELIKTQPGFQ